jgi:hypothetical protein
MKHIYVCWKAIYKYKTYLCLFNCTFFKDERKTIIPEYLYNVPNTISFSDDKYVLIGLSKYAKIVHVCIQVILTSCVVFHLQARADNRTWQCYQCLSKLET